MNYIGKQLLLLAAWCSFFGTVCSHGQTTTVHRADWFKEARFGLFIHWGLYSILGGTYNGRTLPDTTLKNGNSWYAEWIQQRLEVPNAEYRELASRFNPLEFDAETWIQEAKNAGMRYFVITAKHHDGFALWDSNVSEYDLGSTPYKKDLLGDLANACRKYGLKFGFYYSHCEDWDHPGGAVPSWLPQKNEADFEKYWREKCLPQVSELIQRYDPDLFWFDTWGDEQEKLFISDKRRDELISLIRKQAPKCLINGRISWLSPGNDIDFLEMMDNAYPNQLQMRPWQTPATMVESWGWHAKDYNWKPASEMVGYLVSNTSKGGNYLLNIGPKPDGSMPVMAIRRLREIGGWMAANGEAVYGAVPVNLEMPKGVVATQKKIASAYNLYISLINPQTSNELILPFSAGDIKACSMLDTAMPIAFNSAGEGKVKLLLPEKVAAVSDGVQVLRLTLKSDKVK